MRLALGRNADTRVAHGKMQPGPILLHGFAGDCDNYLPLVGEFDGVAEQIC